VTNYLSVKASVFETFRIVELSQHLVRTLVVQRGCRSSNSVCRRNGLDSVKAGT